MKILAAALAGALLTTGGAASAQSATDAQCLILSNAFATGSKDEQQKKAAESAFYFYLGRIGNQTSAQLKTLFDTQAKAITDKTAGESMNKCIQAIETKVGLLQSIAPKQQQQQQQPQGR